MKIVEMITVTTYSMILFLSNQLSAEEITFDLKKHEKVIAKKIAKDSAQVQLSVLDPESYFFKVELKQFPPNEIVTFFSFSKDETVQNELQIPSNGELQFLLQPGVVGYTGGVSRVIVLRADEALSIEYNWGKK